MNFAIQTQMMTTWLDFLVLDFFADLSCNLQRARSLDPNLDIEDTPMPLRTPGKPRKPPTEMTLEEKERANLIDVRCLTLCVGMLERVESVC